MKAKRLIGRSLIVFTVCVFCGSCSMGRMVAQGSVSILDGGIEAMLREPDLDLAQAAMPANLKLMEGLIYEAPENLSLREFAAQGFYGYTFGFVEDVDRERASELYARCLEHALHGLRILGFRADVRTVDEAELQKQLSELGINAVPSLSWGASCWAKSIDMDRDNLAKLADLSRSAALMQRALELDESYYYGSPHLFFGVYYGSRPPIFGGDYAKAEQHFEKARALSGGDDLLVDVLQAQFLDRQMLDREAFHERLTRVLNGDAAKNPELTLQNRISQEKAMALLAKEDEWF